MKRSFFIKACVLIQILFMNIYFNNYKIYFSSKSKCQQMMSKN